VAERTAAKNQALSHHATTDQDQGCARYADGLGPGSTTPGSVKPIVVSRSLGRSKWRSILPEALAFTAEGNLVQEATGYEHKGWKPRLSGIGFPLCECRASRRHSNLSRDAQIPPIGQKNRTEP